MKMRMLLCTLVGGLLLLPCLASASPLDDYKLGKTSVDMALYPSLEGTVGYGISVPIEGRTTVFDWRVTTGLGDKYAIQYHHFNPESEIAQTPFLDFANPAFVKLDFAELNLLYRLDDRTSLLLGRACAKPSIRANEGGFAPDSKKIYQVGIVHDMKIADKTHLYGIAALGKKLVNIEIGVSYEIQPNMELNLTYRELKVDEFTSGDQGPYDFKFNGFGLGASLKF